MTTKLVLFKDSVFNADQIALLSNDAFSINNNSLNTNTSSIKWVVVDLGLVVSEFHLKIAASKALLNESQGRMKTKSIQAEILYQLSPTSKITDALLQFSVSLESKMVAFIFVSQEIITFDKNYIYSIIFKHMIGNEIEPSSILSPEILNKEKKEKLIKNFKITQQEVEEFPLEDALITKLAIKDV
jgi:tRNA threonylcarbamoyladenosine modification (KEOPS) complex Cgi121 subunit